MNLFKKEDQPARIEDTSVMFQRLLDKIGFIEKKLDQLLAQSGQRRPMMGSFNGRRSFRQGPYNNPNHNPNRSPNNNPNHNPNRHFSPRRPQQGPRRPHSVTPQG